MRRRPPRPRPARSVERIVEKEIVYQPIRQKLPRTRTSRTFEFRVADCKGFVTVGEYDDGRPGEIFVRVSKQGSTLAGIMDAFAISVSHGLQYGVPLRSFVEAFTGMRFEPAGMTDDPDMRIANSLMDYLFRKLALVYLSPDERAELNIFSTAERMQPTLPGVEETRWSRPGRAPRSRPTRRRSSRPPSWPPAWRRHHGATTRAGQPRRADVHAVRRPDAAGRLLPRLPQLRHHQRLQLRFRSTRSVQIVPASTLGVDSATI